MFGKKEQVQSGPEINDAPKQKKPVYKKWWFWVVVVLLVVVLIPKGNTKTDTPAAASSASVSSAAAQSVASASAATSVQSTGESSEYYKSGTYKVGSDIQAGEYFVVCDGFQAYVEVSKDSSGNLDSIIANDNVSTFTFITVSDGQYLTVNSGKFIEAAKAEVPAADNGVYSAGTYRVGTDIQAGEYKVTCTDSLAYVEVCKDSTGAFDSIVTNDNIENSGYITVSDGQYLSVSGGEFSAA